MQVLKLQRDFGDDGSGGDSGGDNAHYGDGNSNGNGNGNDAGGGGAGGRGNIINYPDDAAVDWFLGHRARQDAAPGHIPPPFPLVLFSNGRLKLIKPEVIVKEVYYWGKCVRACKCL